MTALESQLVVGALLFALGLLGFLTRRNLILIMLSVELMLHGVAVNLTGFGRYHGNASGQVFTIFMLTIAACEAGLALALILTLYQRRKSLDVQLWSQLGEPDLPQLAVDEPPVTLPPAEPLPRLTPAGRAPTVAAGIAGSAAEGLQLKS
jgi:NADH-quinone oxidoreductase subunit K